MLSIISIQPFSNLHDYMKGEYTAFAYNGKNRDVLAVKLPIVEEQIAQAENKGLFDNPKQFKDTMAELQLDRRSPTNTLLPNGRVVVG